MDELHPVDAIISQIIELYINRAVDLAKGLGHPEGLLPISS